MGRRERHKISRSIMLGEILILHNKLILNTDELPVVVKMLPYIQENSLKSHIISWGELNDILKTVKTTIRNLG